MVYGLVAGCDISMFLDSTIRLLRIQPGDERRGCWLLLIETGMTHVSIETQYQISTKYPGAVMHRGEYS